MDLEKELQQLKERFFSEIKEVKNAKILRDLEIKYLGRRAGELTKILRQLKEVPLKKRPQIGQLANQLKQEFLREITGVSSFLKKKAKREDWLDITVPGTKFPEGHLHLVTQAIREIMEIFERIGFTRVRYPEVEWDWYAFESLNMPPDHPARDEWETFFIDSKPIRPKGQRILTPHSTSGDVREMEKKKIPIRMINITKCYRRQIDASHVPMFHQFDGLMIDRDVTIAHLKGVIDYFLRQFFGSKRRYRLRPFHFQFTEPSFEIDISCGVCGGRGCKLCKRGWVELAGAGMVHPNVLKAGKIDPRKYSGWAFGWGIERAYLMKAGLSIPDIRILYQNDLRFLNQF